jgi:uncharacterized protein
VADHSALIEIVARALADEPGAVRVQVGERRGAAYYELHVAPRDLGRVIGRQGRTAAALRLLLSSAAEMTGGKAQLDIRDTDGRS